MNARSQFGCLLLLAIVSAPVAAYQNFQPQGSGTSGGQQTNAWSSRQTGQRTATATSNGVGRQRVAQYTSGTDVLPQTAGQVWRNYDITPYTKQFDPTYKPEQEIIDWILRDTGTDLWFTEPLGILSATNTTLRVYHTPEVQAVVHDIVDRFVDPQAKSQAMSFQLVAVGSPDWRTKWYSYLQPIQVQSDGVQGWLINKENAMQMLGDLKRRSDYQELQGPNLYVASGRTEILTRTVPRNYVSGFAQNPQEPLQIRQSNASVSEGFSLELSALRSLDGNAMDAVVRCNVNKIERFQTVPIDLYNPFGQPDRREIEIPQMANWRLHERFRWPSNQVLLLSCGVVATPGASRNPVPLVGDLIGNKGRADALLFLEVHRANDPAIYPPSAARGTNGVRQSNVNSQGRY